MLKDARAPSLKRVPVFAKLSAASLEHVAQACTWHKYDSGEQILNYQDPTTNVFFLISGKVRVIIYSSEGKAVVFTSLESGTMFGEIAAIDRQPRSATVEALEPCTIASLADHEFEELMLREPSVAVATLRYMAADMRRLSERVFEFSTLMVQNRIQAELLRLAGEAGEAVLSPAPSLAEIASRISTHREAVSRELSRLTALGLLRREDGNLRITNLAKLVEFVNIAKGE